MKHLKIVLAMLEPPLPFGNAAARWYYVLLKELVARGHHVRAFAACSKAEEIPKAAKLFPAPHYDLKLYLFPNRSGWRAKWQTLRRPYSYMFSKAMIADVLNAVADGADVIHLDQLNCLWLTYDHPRLNSRTLVNVHFLSGIDLEFTNSLGFRHWCQTRLMLSTERRLLRQQVRFTALSDRLAEGIRRVQPTANVTVNPLGLDYNLYAFISDDQRPREPVISVIGSMNWYPSLSAAIRLLTQLWPEIRRRVPTVRLNIVGWDAKRALAAYADTPAVTIEENVPDTQPYFAATSVLVYAPARGSGMKVKVLEALAYGIPVVTTSEGSEGLPAVDGVHLGLCEDNAGLVDRVVALLNDPMLQNRQRAAGRALLESHCGPKPTVDNMEAVYARMIAEGRDL
ncbi:hypothetical protein BH11PLA2_BH11PLA2_26710 [soil metagenome]